MRNPLKFTTVSAPIDRAEKNQNLEQMAIKVWRQSQLIIFSPEAINYFSKNIYNILPKKTLNFVDKK